MDKKIYIGAAYYPELWAEEDIEKDIQRCKSLGINTLRVGEFAWSKMEPSEGVFDFKWLEKVVDKLYENGIYTVMCTPTCTPPRWMLNKYPEMRGIDWNNKKPNVSSRCHPCKTVKIMREKNRIIVTEMAKVFAGRKGIIGWQIDNEMMPYKDGCFCEECKSAFRGYLKDIYGSIENLNKKWGMARWSLDYSSFEEIEPPYPDEWRHPSLRKAWWDFQCRQIITYIDEQAEILHNYGCNNVGTDMMPFNTLDYYRTNKNLDRVMYNHYEWASELMDTAFAYDFLRCIKDKPFWVTETQVGWNGSEFAECGFRPVGNCYANTWLPLSKGAEMNLYWLFRAQRSGHEIGHGALFSSAGREYRVSDEVREVCNDLQKCGDFLTQSKVESKIALHYSSASEVDFAYAPLIKGFDYRKNVTQKYYNSLRGYNVDVIDPSHGLDGYEIVISPFLLETETGDFRKRITEWIERGGTWIAGPLTDVYDGHLSKYVNSPFGFLEELAGVYTKYQKPLDNNVFKAKWTDGNACGISKYFDAYECNDGTESLAKYTEGEFKGLSVITERKIGKGKIILVGSVISHNDLLKLVNKKPIAETSDNVIITERTGKQNGIIAVETENKNGYIVLNGEYTELITGKKLNGKTEIAPHQVMVLKK